LPEPGRGASGIEYTPLMRIRRQPRGFNYDRLINQEEERAFKKRVRDMAERDCETREWATKRGIL